MYRFTLQFFWLSIGFACLIPTQVTADVRTGDKVNIAADETVDDDLYVFAEEITIAGTVKGDVIAFARKVTINGVVEGDLLGAAQAIVISGTVNDDIRIAAQTIVLELNAKVLDDLITAGMSLNCKSGSNIAGEVKYAGYQAFYGGHIEKDLNSATANCELAGSFGGNVELMVREDETDQTYYFNDAGIAHVSPGLTISETAKITGNLDYKSPHKAAVDPAAQILGSINHEEIEPALTSPPTATNRLASAVKHFFALLLVGLVVTFAFPRWTNQVTENIQQRPLGSFLWGIGSIIGVVVATLLLIACLVIVTVTLGTLSLESLLPAWLAIALIATLGIVAGFTVFAVWVSKIVVAVWAGNLIWNSDDLAAGKKLVRLAAGVFLIACMTAIPFAGGAFSLLATLFGCGAATIWLLSCWSSRSSQDNATHSIPIKHAA